LAKRKRVDIFPTRLYQGEEEEEEESLKTTKMKQWKK
jgi:hypothetical protein